MAGTAPECYDWVYPEIKPVPGSLKGQVVFVSGASRGIGRSIALCTSNSSFSALPRC